ncbi:MAG: hypothetical protein P8L66_01580 [Rhodospirillaceae bacterium]|nr:hypothetical protein [Rhodospirillaceae bacterium]
MSSIFDDVTTTLDTLCTCWTNMDQPAIRDLWDPEEAEPYFLPQEIREPIIGWDKLTACCANA